MTKTLTTLATVAALAAGAGTAHAAADYRGTTAAGVPIRFEYHLGDVTGVKTDVPVTCRHEASYDIFGDPLPGSDRTRSATHPVLVQGPFRIGRTTRETAPGELLRGQTVRAAYEIAPRGLRFATIGGTVAVTSSIRTAAAHDGPAAASSELWTCAGETTFTATTRRTPARTASASDPARAAAADELHTDAEGATLSARCRPRVARTLPLEGVLRRGVPVPIACDGPAFVGATVTLPAMSAQRDAWERMHGWNDPELGSFEPRRLERAGTVTVRLRLHPRAHDLLRRFPRSGLRIVGRQQDELEPLLFHSLGLRTTTLVR